MKTFLFLFMFLNYTTAQNFKIINLCDTTCTYKLFNSNQKLIGKYSIKPTDSICLTLPYKKMVLCRRLRKQD